jgi:hypothetical protein
VENFGPVFGGKLQSVGEEFLPLPEDLKPDARPAQPAAAPVKVG